MASQSWREMAETAELSDYEPIPDGVYDFVVKKAEHKKTQNGKDMYKIGAAVESGPYAGRYVWDNLVVSPENPKAMGMFFMKMKALGLTAENFFNSEPTDEQVVERLSTARFRARVNSETYNGKVNNKFKDYMPAGVVAGAPAPPPSAPAQAQAQVPAPPAAPTTAVPAPPPPPVNSPF